MKVIVKDIKTKEIKEVEYDEKAKRLLKSGRYVKQFFKEKLLGTIKIKEN